LILCTQIEAAAKTLQGMGVEAVLVKLGADGSLLLPGASIQIALSVMLKCLYAKKQLATFLSISSWLTHWHFL
jgi:hypothetical protein